MGRKIYSSFMILVLVTGLFSCNNKNTAIANKPLRDQLPKELGLLLEKTAGAEINIANCKKGIRLLDSAEKHKPPKKSLRKNAT
ncbi:hypothetical protein [Pedobacter sp. ASV12]|uniref:hypothetical protein n=1 Tax=Pedobacter sp. ASV12 TaxID=2795120 RepID=UPI0018EAA1C6|nr:hypothetical protein [Pedobacter sp. ASV12]